MKLNLYRGVDLTRLVEVRDLYSAQSETYWAIDELIAIKQKGETYTKADVEALVVIALAARDTRPNCAQPERRAQVYTHGLTLTPADIAEITGVPVKPSPPPTDDSELVRLLVNVKDLLSIYEGRVDGTISRIDRAIAALGEKEKL